MRYCASKSWEQSNTKLQRKVPAALYQQWQEATKAVCAAADAPSKDGTIDAQLVVGCDEDLNIQGDPERTPCGRWCPGRSLPSLLG